MKHKIFYLAGGLLAVAGAYFFYTKKSSKEDVFASLESKNKQYVATPPLESEQKPEEPFEEEFYQVSKSVISNPSEIGL
jgi:hypothetical protein